MNVLKSFDSRPGIEKTMIHPVHHRRRPPEVTLCLGLISCNRGFAELWLYRTGLSSSLSDPDEVQSEELSPYPQIRPPQSKRTFLPDRVTP